MITLTNTGTHLRSMHSVIHQSSGACSCITTAESMCYFWATAHPCSHGDTRKDRRIWWDATDKETEKSKHHNHFAKKYKKDQKSKTKKTLHGVEV